MKDRIYIWYVIFYYFLPWSLILSLKTPYRDRFNIDLDIKNSCFLVFLLLFVGFAIHYTPELRFNKKKPVFKKLLVILILILPFYLYGIYEFFNLHGISFRHTNRLINVTLLTKILILSKPLVVLTLIYLLNYLKYKRKFWQTLVFISSCLGLLGVANAAFDWAIAILLIILYFSGDDYLKNSPKPTKLILTFSIVSSLIFSILYIGINNKNTDLKLFSILSDLSYYKDFIDHLLLRISVYSVSTYRAIFDYGLMGDQGFFQIYFDNIDYILKRFNGLDAEVITLNRINYFEIYTYSRESSRTGTSPGFIATILYFPYFIPGFLLGLFIFTTILTFWQKITAFCSHNIFSYLLLFLFFIPLVDGFYGIFTVFDVNFINYIYLWFLSKRT